MEGFKRVKQLHLLLQQQMLLLIQLSPFVDPLFNTIDYPLHPLPALKSAFLQQWTARTAPVIIATSSADKPLLKPLYLRSIGLNEAIVTTRWNVYNTNGLAMVNNDKQQVQQFVNNGCHIRS